MKQHSELTETQKEAIALWEQRFGGLLATFVAAAERAGAARLATNAALHVTPAIAELDPTAVIPSARNFSGCESVTAAEFAQMQTLAGQLNTMMNQNIVLITKFIGTANVG